MHIGRRGGHRVNQLSAAIDAYVGFHAKVPLVALLHLMHLRVTLAIFVLGRTGRIDDRGIHDGAGVDGKAVVFKVFGNQCKQLIAQVVRLQKMTEFAYRVSSGAGSRPRSMPTRRMAQSYNAS